MRRISDACLAVVTMVFVISLAVLLTLQLRPLYYSDIERLNIVETSGYSEAEIRENYDALIDYNLSPFQKGLTLPSMPMSEEARIHFQEVKAIFQLILKLFIGSAVLLSVGSLWKNERRECRYLLWGAVLTVIFPTVCGILIAVNWDNAFVLFHELLFSNDYWLFDPAVDPVIKILPDAYFLHCAQTIIAIVLIGAGGCLALWKKKTAVFRSEKEKGERKRESKKGKEKGGF